MSSVRVIRSGHEDLTVLLNVDRGAYVDDGYCGQC